MVRGFIIIIFLFLISGSLFSQNKEHYDTLTYNDWIAGNWKELIIHGKEAEANNALSIYGEKRMGYANYMLGNFFSSISYYDMVLDFEPDNTDVMLMLYLDYYYTANSTQMNRIRGMLSDSAFATLKLPDWKWFESIYAEGGESSNNNYNNDKANLYSNPHYFGTQTLYGNTSYGQLGIKLNLSNNISTYMSVKQSLINTEQRIGFTYTHPNGIGGNSISDTSVSSKFKTTQQEFYINSTFAFNNGSFTPYFHLVMGNAGGIGTTWFDQNHQTPPPKPRDTITRIFSFSDTTISTTDFLIGASISKQIGKLVFEGNFGISNFAYMHQVQVGASMIYYPFGNTHFSIAPQIKYLKDSLNHDLITQLNISMMLHKFCWLTLYGSLGDLEHSNEMNGSVIFNNSDIINNRYGATLFLPVSNTIHIYLDYQLQLCQSWVWTATNPTHNTLVFSNYQNNYITLGLKFNL